MMPNFYNSSEKLTFRTNFENYFSSVLENGITKNQSTIIEINQNTDKILVLVIGGTNWHYLEVDGENLDFNDTSNKIKSGRMPKINNGEEFLECLENITKEIDFNKLFINLAFPLRNNSEIHKHLYLNAKNYYIDSLHNVDLEKVLTNRLSKTVKVFNDLEILNQCLLSKGVEVEKNICSSMILGTGFNLGVNLPNQNFLNLEVGKFSNFHLPQNLSFLRDLGEIDLMEKLTAGAFQDKLFELIREEKGVEKVNFTGCIFETEIPEYRRLVSEQKQISAYFSSLCLFETIRLVKNQYYNSQNLSNLYIQLEGSVILKSRSFLQIFLTYLQMFNEKEPVFKNIEILSDENSNILGFF